MYAKFGSRAETQQNEMVDENKSRLSISEFPGYAEIALFEDILKNHWAVA